MARTVVLVRHGKAQTRSEERPDEQRALTTAGCRALAAWLPRTASQLLADGVASVAVWASPTERTCETAAMLIEELEHAGIEIESFEEAACLFDQDVTAFVDAVRNAESDVVVAVGHNPFCEDATTHLTGADIRFATGAVAALRLEDADAVTPDAPGEDGAGCAAPMAPARLLWFIQGPESKRWKNVRELEKVVAEAAGNVKARLQAFFDDPDDVEAAHKARVSIRTLRGLLSFVAPFIDREQEKAMQRDLRDCVRVTSRLRELDVLSEQLAQFEAPEIECAPAPAVSPADAEAPEQDGRSVPDPAENPVPPKEELLAACAQARDAECRRVVKALSSKKYRKRLSRALKAARKLKWKRRIVEFGIGADAIGNRFARVSGKVESDIAALDLSDAEWTHDVRKQAKQARYAAERFGDLIGDGAQEVAARMKAEQDRLGALCDARVNVQIADEFPADGLSAGAAQTLQAFRAQNEEYIREALS